MFTSPIELVTNGSHHWRYVVHAKIGIMIDVVAGRNGSSCIQPSLERTAFLRCNNVQELQNVVI